jgi:hypothetical protein
MERKKMKIQTSDPKALLIIGLAFVAGGGAGFFIAKKLLEEHYQELAEEEIMDVRAYFTKKYANEIEVEEKEENRKLVERYAKPSPEDLIGKVQSVKTTEDGVIIEGNIDPEFFDEVEYVEYDDDDLEDEEHPEYLEEDDEPEPRDEPYLIDYTVFMQDNGYEKIDLYYYRFDSIMCTENDEILHSPYDILGWDWEEAVERKSTVFVRSETIETDYEIHALSKSYNEEVSIRLETDKEKNYRRLARTKEAMDARSMEYEEEKPRKPKTTPYKRPKNQKINYNDIPMDNDLEQEG